MYAQHVQGATAYQFKFTPLDGQHGGVNQYQTRPTRLYQFSYSSIAFEAGEYSVEVRVLAGNTWGSFTDVDPDCTINIIETGSMIAPMDDIVTTKSSTVSDMDAVIYPNPNSGEQLTVRLNDLEDANQRIQVQVVDFTGKVVYSEALVNKGSQANFLLDFNGRLANGMYFIDLQVNDRRLVEKFIVK
jgi:hypothetical protein